ncbi:hypothetical protein FBUS_03625 [Fasciolopsis buskii]|uniref:Trematode PH-like domain-containing protein n=1 Tax=Fasciolopsis buskii TaxID=27845 RepID=A0A8E0RQE1_9TREM|nr:hypothetical protein FBUS_03625 [Fasciolopsis buski]
MTRNTSKSLSASKARSSQSVNGEIIDRKTKQVVFFKSTVCSIAKQIRASEDAYQEALIGKLLASQLKKRHAHGAEILCLEDRLNFKKTKVFSKTPFRNWVLYSDIEHYFVFPGHDHLFMLVIKSTTPGKSLFETYKCKTAEETTRLRRLVCQACTDPMKKLRFNNENNRPCSTVSEVSLHENAISQPNIHEAVNGNVEEDECNMDDQHSATSEEESDKDDVFPEVEDINAKTETITKSAPGHPVDFSDVRQLSPVSFNEASVVMTKTTPLHSVARSESPADDDADDESDVVMSKNDEECTTYFDYDSKTGAVLNEEGPIFMYFRRFPVPKHENGYD